MQGHEKTRHISFVSIQSGAKEKPTRYRLSEAEATLTRQICENFRAKAELENESIPAEAVFPELRDSNLRPAIALRGARAKMGLSQKELAKRLHIEQGNLSKMETGSRPIGKELARRLAAELKVDYRLFL
jgi:ribosome-binding protein aMBF1 (putative translation factor)